MLTVFLALPWLGYEYVRELERFLRDAQERTLAGTAQAVATALHDRPRLFAHAADPIASFARERADEAGGDARAAAVGLAGDRADRAGPVAHDGAHLGDRSRRRRARARGLAASARADAGRADDAGARGWQALEQALLHPLYARILTQPTEDFSDDAPRRGAAARPRRRRRAVGHPHHRPAPDVRRHAR